MKNAGAGLRSVRCLVQRLRGSVGLGEGWRAVRRFRGACEGLGRASGENAVPSASHPRVLALLPNLHGGGRYSSAAAMVDVEASPGLEVGEPGGAWKLAAIEGSFVAPELGSDDEMLESSTESLGFDMVDSKFMLTANVQTRVQFLREWGLSEANLAKLQSHLGSSVRSAVLRISLAKLTEVGNFLTKEVGLSKAQAAKCLFENVYLGSSSVTTSLRPKVEYFQQLGFSQKQLVKVIFRSPQVLTFNMERRVLPMTRKLIDLGLKPEDIVKAYTKHPSLSSIGINKIDQIMEFLQGFGLVNAPKYFTSHPQIFTMSLDGKIMQTTEYFKNEVGLGPAQLSRVFRWATIFSYSVEDNLRVKTEYFRSLGISKDDVARMIALYPCIYGHSMEKCIKPKVDYLLTVLKKDIKELVHFPQYMSYSLSSRTKPRYEYAVALGCVFDSLSFFLSCSDEIFKRRCQNRVAKSKTKEVDGMKLQAGRSNILN